MFQLEEIAQKIEMPKNLKKTNIVYYLIKPFAKAHIYYDGKDIIYELVEPKLTKKENEIFENLYQGLLQLIDLSPTQIETHKKLIAHLENKIKFLLKDYGYKISDKQYNKLMYFIYRDFVGLNEIEPLMHDDYVEDINCNGIKTPIYIRHRMFGNVKTNVVYKDEKRLKNFIIKLAQRCNKYITYLNPFLEGSLEDGSRVEGTISEEVCPRGPNFSIRKFRRIPFSPVELIYLKTISAKAIAYLWYLIENGANILIIGGSGAGKTTMLNSILTFIPSKAKIVSIEDIREIRIYHENWIATVSRESIGGLKIGEINLDKLLRESFRENPDYVVVGEVRGKETYVMFQGMASGHPTLSTFHSEDVSSIVSRLNTPPINLPSSLIQLLDVIITVVKTEKENKIIRKVKNIEELLNIDEKTKKVITNKILTFDFSKNRFIYNANSKILEKLSINQGIKLNEIKEEIKRREKFLLDLVKKKIFEMHRVQKEIEKYCSKL